MKHPQITDFGTCGCRQNFQEDKGNFKLKFEWGPCNITKIVWSPLLNINVTGVIMIMLTFTEALFFHNDQAWTNLLVAQAVARENHD